MPDPKVSRQFFINLLVTVYCKTLFSWVFNNLIIGGVQIRQCGNLFLPNIPMGLCSPDSKPLKQQL